MLLKLDEQIEKINVVDKTKTLGERMKEYEHLTRFKLDKELPMIIRLDGNAFHTFTRGFDKPFDWLLVSAMELTSLFLLEKIPGAQLSYNQSDEISILVTNYKLSNTQPWFDNNISKIVSITAAMATLEFNRVFKELIDAYYADIYDLDEDSNEKKLYENYKKSFNRGAIFDSRVFLLPKDEVTNYFIWRQEDAIKNAISMVAQFHFSHKSLQNQNGNTKVNRLLMEKDIDFEKDFPVSVRRGTVGHRLAPVAQVKEITMKDGTKKIIEFERSEWGIDTNIPEFKKDKKYIEKFI